MLDKRSQIEPSPLAPLSQEFAAVLQAQKAGHQEDDAGHDHHDAVLEQDHAPDGGVDVLRLLIRVYGDIPDLILNKRSVAQNQRQDNRKHREYCSGASVADKR